MAVLVVAGTLAYRRLQGPEGLRALDQKREAIRALGEENGRLEEEVARLRKVNHDLENHEDTIRLWIERITGKAPKGAREFRESR